MKDYYQTLGLDRSASGRQIKHAYRELCKQMHPDRSKSPDANARMREINEAYRALSSPTRKPEYDQLLRLHDQQRETGLDAASEAGHAGHCRCERCGLVDSSLRVTVFTWVLSLLFVSLRRGWAKILCARCRTRYALLFDLQNFFMGWWGFPFGPIWTLGALWHNSMGGHQPKENNALFLAGLGYELYRKGDVRGAIKALAASLALRKDDRVEAFYRQTRDKLSENHGAAKPSPRAPLWRQLASGALHPAIYCAPLLGVLFWLGYIWVGLEEKTTKIAGTAASPTRPATPSRPASVHTNTFDQNVVRRAEAGDARSQYLVGLAYAGGSFDGRTNETAALQWLRRAAETAYAPAELELARRLARSASRLPLGESRNRGLLDQEKEALAWYRRAGAQGLSEAQFDLAWELWNYASDAGDEQAAAQMLREAVVWQRRAAEQGHPEAAFQVAMSYTDPGGEFAQRYRLGDIAQKDVPEAVKWCRKAADLGHVEAQFQLELLLSVAARGGTQATNRIVFSDQRSSFGLRSRIGPLEEDWTATNRIVDAALESESWKWCRRAAENTNVNAALRLALHCENGEDYQGAARWWRRAADQEDVPAAIHLAEMYDNGRGVSEDHTEAANLLFRIVHSFGRYHDYCCSLHSLCNSPGALFSLAERFESGLGVRQDPVEAYKWFDLVVGGSPPEYGYNPFPRATPAGGFTNLPQSGLPALDESWGVEYRAFKLAELARDRRDALGKRMTPDQISKAQARATVYLASFWGGEEFTRDLKDAENGDAAAQLRISRAYWQGEYGRKNCAEGLKWMQRAAELDYAEAQCKMGDCYYDGSFRWGCHVQKDPQRAAMYFRQAAEQGEPRAQFRLALCYANGIGESRNVIQAYKWLRIALAGEQAWDQQHPDPAVAALKGLGIALAGGASGFRDNVESCLAEVAARMTPEQVAFAEAFAKEFVPRKNGLKGATDRRTADLESPNAAGSGFFISEDGALITNFHVVEGASRIVVRANRGSFAAKVAKLDPVNDVAVIEVSGSGFRPLPLTPSRNMKLGDAVFTIGFPNPSLQGVEPKFTDGKIGSLSGPHDDARYFQISVAVQPGNSGGALVNSVGNVVGIVTASLSDRAALETSGALPQNVNYAIKSSYILSLLESTPRLAGKLKEPWTARERKIEDIVKEAQEAAALVLAY